MVDLLKEALASQFMKKHRGFFYVLTVLFVGILIFVQGNKFFFPSQIAEEHGISIQSDYVTYFKTNIEYSPHAVHSQPDLFSGYDKQALNFGNVGEKYLWLRIDLSKLPISKYGPWYAFIQFLMPIEVMFYQFSGDSLTQVDDFTFNKPLSSRRKPSPSIVVPIRDHFGKEQNIAYVKMIPRNGTVAMSFDFYEDTEQRRIENLTIIFNSIFFGVMLAMIIYNLFLFIAVPERAYFYHVVYASLLLLLFLTLTGAGAYFFWSNFPYLNAILLMYLPNFVVIFILLFAKHFIEVEKYSPYFDQLYNLAILIGLVLLPSYAFGGKFLSLIMGGYCSIVILLLISSAIRCWQAGSKRALFFLVAWSLFFLSVIWYLFVFYQLVESNIWSRNFIFVGACAEVLLLSLALANVISAQRQQQLDLVIEQNKTYNKLQQAEEKVIYQAFHSERGLPNRSMLRNQFERRMIHMNQNCTLLLFGVSQYHSIKRTMGNYAAQDLTIQLVEVMKAIISPDDVILLNELDGSYIAETENSQLAVYFKGSDKSEVESKVRSLLRLLPVVIYLDNVAINLDVRVGAALFNEHGKSFEELLANAQIALEHVENNQLRFSYYNDAINPYSERSLSLLGDLRTAIVEDQLEIYVQPKIELKTGVVKSCEVLLRWNHPEYGFVSPMEFITIAEKTRLIFSLTNWVFKQAYILLDQLQKQSYDLSVAINVSAVCVNDTNFQRQALRNLKIDPDLMGRLIVEITETSHMPLDNFKKSVIEKSTDKGIAYSLDDFGTGYSTFSYLKNLPVSEVKLDQSYVRYLVEDKEDREIVRAMIYLGKSLDKIVVAEGVEDRESLELLKTMNCDYAQGYYIARPMPVSDFMQWIKNYRSSEYFKELYTD